MSPCQHHIQYQPKMTFREAGMEHGHIKITGLVHDIYKVYNVL